MEFDEMWHGLTKTVQFQAADMSTPISITLTADLLEDGSTDTYLVPIPAGAKARHGIMRLAVKGAAVNGDIETNAVLAVYGSFTVKESNWSSDAEEAQDVTPTQAEQLQSEIDVLLDEIAALTGHTEDAEAWAVGEREGAPVGPGDETYRNNAKHYAAAAAQKADAVLDMTVSYDVLPEDYFPYVDKSIIGGVYDIRFGISRGMRGYRIGSVYKKSGTGAPGTTDVYGMKLNDPGQTEVGTFSVYNGANGEGSGDFMADGSVPMTGNLNANGHNVVGVRAPTSNTDAANKQYVDDETEKRYTKPSGGIPKTDLAYAVQTSLDAADDALRYTQQTGKTDAQRKAARDNALAAGVEDIGFNLWDEQWEVGGIDANSGLDVVLSDRIRSKGYCFCYPNTTYFHFLNSDSGGMYVWFYDSAKNPISRSGGYSKTRTFTSPANAAFFRIATNAEYGAAYNSDICVNISNPVLNGTYKAFSGIRRDIWRNSIAVEALESADAMIIMDGYVSPVINGVGNYKSGNQYHKRIGRINLGNLNWSKNSASGIAGMFYAAAPTAAKKTLQGETEYYTSAYTVESPTVSSSQFSSKSDKSLWYHVPTTNFQIYILDSSHSADDAAAFKNAMYGKFLYYALAAEETYDVHGDRNNVGSEVLLWENNAPTTEFAAQDIYTTASPSSYKWIRVGFRTAPNFSNTVYMDGIVGDETGNAATVGFGIIASRAFIARSNRVTFKAGTKWTGTAATTDNTVMVPVSIYGIK